MKDQHQLDIPTTQPPMDGIFPSICSSLALGRQGGKTHQEEEIGRTVGGRGLKHHGFFMRLFRTKMVERKNAKGELVGRRNKMFPERWCKPFWNSRVLSLKDKRCPPLLRSDVVSNIPV